MTNACVKVQKHNFKKKLHCTLFKLYRVKTQRSPGLITNVFKRTFFLWVSLADLKYSSMCVKSWKVRCCSSQVE